MTTIIKSAVMNVPKSIVNGCSVSGYTAIPTSNGGNLYSAARLLSGVLTANQLKTILSVSGSGSVDLLGISGVDGISRTLRLKITIDGIVVFDSTSAIVGLAGYGGFAIGGCAPNTSSFHANPCGNVPFNSSLVVEVASSLPETDKVAVQIAYQTK